ncbi:choline transporter-like protein 2 isoform X2 [Physella acuta]|uniref:choline transporter-like protein 2 isoform X2 n=1 Tax=Physella acuta TaxID=109671 RepID=UPI0027DD115D|nr:choline transporter-like protein 2 isoform X2 [Physella acuta]XP_059157347.1 choline transporter-like protein 2 isoform X2 [Physella acuta]
MSAGQSEHARRTQIAPEPDEEKKLVTRSPEKFLEGSSDADVVDGRILKEYGEPIKFDPSFKGPIKNRLCTDVICCIIFVVFLFGMVVVSIIGYARGNPRRLIYPTDSQGSICGVGKHVDKPYLFFFDMVTCAKMGPAIVSGCPTPQVCVKECPKTNYVYLQNVADNDRSKLICRYDVDHSVSPYKEMTIQKLVESNLCASYYLESKSIVGRCMPIIFSKALDMANVLKDDAGKNIVRANGESITGGLIQNGTLSLAEFYKLKGTMELLFKDVINSAHWIAICLLVAMVVAMIWIVLLRWITTVMVWATILLFIALFAFGTYYSYDKYYELKNMNATTEFGLPQAFMFNFQYFLSLKQTWLAFGCTGATILLIFLIIIMVLCSRIMLATKLISEASVAISYMWCVLFWPLVPFILQFLIIAYWISSMVFISSMGEPEYLNNGTNEVNNLLSRVPCDHTVNGSLSDLCSFVKYGGDMYKTPMLIFMTFMFFWLINFIIALEQMTLAGAFASYYWAWDKKKDIPAFPLGSSFYRSLRYHMGSLAFGSLIVAIIQLIRALLEYVNRKLKGSENRVAIFVLKCLRCCFWCLEKFLRYVNKNAYILIAIHGRNFCTAAKDGFLLIMRNVLRAAVLDKVCDFLMLISKLMITGAVAILAFFLFQGKIPLFAEVIPHMNYFLFPVLLTAIGTYLISDSFFDVYSMAVDTIFLCFLEDCERNDGSAEKPYFMSKTKNLKRMLHK